MRLAIQRVVDCVHIEWVYSLSTFFSLTPQGYYYYNHDQGKTISGLLPVSTAGVYIASFGIGFGPVPWWVPVSQCRAGDENSALLLDS